MCTSLVKLFKFSFSFSSHFLFAAGFIIPANKDYQKQQFED